MIQQLLLLLLPLVPVRPQLLVLLWWLEEATMLEDLPMNFGFLPKW
jgi:hypothetical protein